MRNSRRFVIALFTLFAAAAQAQVLDLQTGRGADMDTDAPFSAEGGIALGQEIFFGARGNLRVGEFIAVGADLGLSDEGDGEAAIGFFGLYQLPLDLPVPVAAKASFHTTIEGDTSMNDITVEAITGGPVADYMTWYANAGLHFVTEELEDVDRKLFPDADTKDEAVVLQVGGGLTYSFTDEAAAFAGVDLLWGDIYGDLVVGGGVRWSFQ